MHPIHPIVSIILLFPLAEGRMNFFSFCDLPSQRSEWKRNNGYAVQTWIQSIVPRVSASNESSWVEFEANENYSVLRDLISWNSGIRWRAYGNKFRDGWLTGPIDDQGNFVPGKTLYIFPDFKTALLGTFERFDKLLEGVEVRIISYRCKKGVLEVSARDRTELSPVYSSFTPTTTTLSPYPRIRDPQDRANVYVGRSLKYPELLNEDSLFARKDFPPHSMISYYLGYFVRKDITSNHTLGHDFFKNLITYNETNHMNMPQEAADIKNFFTVLGHKVNHDFSDDNIIFGFCKHPIYGELRCLVSKKWIKKGQEIFANYNYNMTGFQTPTWYKHLYNLHNQKIEL